MQLLTRSLLQAWMVLILAQVILGFGALGTGSAAIAWIHFVNALAIYGIAVSGAFIAMRWKHVAEPIRPTQ